MKDTIQRGKIDMISAVELWFFAIGAFLLPIVLIVVWKIKTGAKMAPFWCGMIVFFVFAMLLEQVSHYIFLVMPWAGSEYIKNHTFAYAC